MALCVHRQPRRTRYSPVQSSSVRAMASASLLTPAALDAWLAAPHQPVSNPPPGNPPPTKPAAPPPPPAARATPASLPQGPSPTSVSPAAAPPADSGGPAAAAAAPCSSHSASASPSARGPTSPPLVVLDVQRTTSLPASPAAAHWLERPTALSLLSPAAQAAAAVFPLHCSSMLLRRALKRPATALDYFLMLHPQLAAHLAALGWTPACPAAAPIIRIVLIDDEFSPSGSTPSATRALVGMAAPQPPADLTTICRVFSQAGFDAHLLRAVPPPPSSASSPTPAADTATSDADTTPVQSPLSYIPFDPVVGDIDAALRSPFPSTLSPTACAATPQGPAESPPAEAAAAPPAEAAAAPPAEPACSKADIAASALRPAARSAAAVRAYLRNLPSAFRMPRMPAFFSTAVSSSSSSSSSSDVDIGVEAGADVDTDAAYAHAHADLETGSQEPSAQPAHSEAPASASASAAGALLSSPPAAVFSNEHHRPEDGEEVGEDDEHSSAASASTSAESLSPLAVAGDDSTTSPPSSGRPSTRGSASHRRPLRFHKFAGLSLLPRLCPAVSTLMDMTLDLTGAGSDASQPAGSGAPSEILPFLFLGNEISASNRTLLDQLAITHLLDLTEPELSVRRPSAGIGRALLHLPLADTLSQDILSFIGTAVCFIDEARQSGGRVLINCKAGISRSPAVGMAYLMVCHGMSLDHAFALVKERRPCVSPNLNFMAQLAKLERALRSTELHVTQPGSPLAEPLYARLHRIYHTLMTPSTAAEREVSAAAPASGPVASAAEAPVREPLTTSAAADSGDAAPLPKKLPPTLPAIPLISLVSAAVREHTAKSRTELSKLHESGDPVLDMSPCLSPPI